MAYEDAERIVSAIDPTAKIVECLRAKAALLEKDRRAAEVQDL